MGFYNKATNVEKSCIQFINIEWANYLKKTNKCGKTLQIRTPNAEFVTFLSWIFWDFIIKRQTWKKSCVTFIYRDFKERKKIKCERAWNGVLLYYMMYKYFKIIQIRPFVSWRTIKRIFERNVFIFYWQRQNDPHPV